MAKRQKPAGGIRLHRQAFGPEKEYGYWRLSELAEVRGPMGLTIERDFYFVPTPLDQCPDPTGTHH